MQKILVTGARGFLARLIRLYNAESFHFIPLTRDEVALEDIEALRTYVEQLDFDICLHLGADATTQHCEDEPELTHRINTEASIVLAEICKARQKRFIFFSTEQCFNDAPGQAPYRESDVMGSTSAYGRQKMEADAWVQNNLDDYLIFRLSWMFGLACPGIVPSPNILAQVYETLRTQTPRKFRVHEWRGLTYAYVLAERFVELMALPSGVYHIAATQEKSTFEAARYIAHCLGASKALCETLILPDTETYADQPRDFRLSAQKLAAAGIDMGTFEMHVERCLRDFGVWNPCV